MMPVLFCLLVCLFSFASAQSAELMTTLNGHTDYVFTTTFTPDGRLLVSGGRDRSIRVWNPQSGKELYVLNTKVGFVHALALSPDGKFLAAGSDDNIKLWDFQSGVEIKTFQGHIDYIHSLAFSPDGKTLASGGYDGTVCLWNIESGKQLGVLKGNVRNIRPVAFSPDGKILATANADTTIQLWDVNKVQLIRTLKGHASDTQTHDVRTLAFSPDGKTLASGAEQDIIRMWDTQTGTEINILKAPVSNYYALTFSPNGKMLAGGFNGAVKLWDTKTGEEVSKLTEGMDFVFSLAFSQDGRMLAAGGRDNTIKLWDTHTLIPQDARLFVSVTPDDSVVKVNGAVPPVDADGLIPVFSEVPIQVSIHKEGFKDALSTLVVEPNQIRSLNVEMYRQHGMVEFVSNPAGATIKIDGVARGKTPLTLAELSLGPLSYALTLEDHQEVTGTVDIVGDTVVPVSVKLKELPGLNFKSAPSGAQVWIAGKMVCEKTPCIVKELKPGPLDFILKLTGHQDFKGRAFVPQEGKGQVSETLTRK